MNKIDTLKEIINKSNNIVFFGGAGTSTDSGIRDFRGKNGLYYEKSEYEPEYLLSSACFWTDTNLFYEYYKKNMNFLNIKPNIIHKYLYNLEKIGKLKAIVTQNIDGLHQLAGSKNVIEIHGTIKKNTCTKCGKKYDEHYIFDNNTIPYCTCGGLIKPDVVLYGEMLPESFSVAEYYIHNCDTLIVAGTSLTVEPASSLIKLFQENNLIIINNDATTYDNKATLVINENLKQVFEKLNS